MFTLYEYHFEWGKSFFAGPMRVSVGLWSLYCAISVVASENSESFFDYPMELGHNVNEQFEHLHSILNKIGKIMEELKDNHEAWDVDLLLNEGHSVTNRVQNDCLEYFKKYEKVKQRVVKLQNQGNNSQTEVG